MGVFRIVDQRIKFYSQNTGLLPPGPGSAFRRLGRGVRGFRGGCVLVPADGAAGSVVVVWRLRCVGTLRRELGGIRACRGASEKERSVVNGRCGRLALEFSVCVKERQDRLPAMCWLPGLHGTPCGARFIANSSSCTATELSKLLTSCLAAVGGRVMGCCGRVCERSGKNLFWSVGGSGEVLGGLKSRGFRAAGLSTLCATLPHGLVEGELVDLIEWTFWGVGFTLYCLWRKTGFLRFWGLKTI